MVSKCDTVATLQASQQRPSCRCSHSIRLQKMGSVFDILTTLPRSFVIAFAQGYFDSNLSIIGFFWPYVTLNRNKSPFSWTPKPWYGFCNLPKTNSTKKKPSKFDTPKYLTGDRKKSGLASELITRVLEQLEPNGQVLRIADKICNILVYIRFLYVEN